LRLREGCSKRQVVKYGDAVEGINPGVPEAAAPNPGSIGRQKFSPITNDLMVVWGIYA
jgi:hypothetical protein